jgi:hypothetical protein
MKPLPFRPTLRSVVGVVIGVVAGYLYYRVVGCVSGTCPISSNPWISTAFGGLIGWLAASRPNNSQESHHHGEVRNFQDDPPPL